MSSAFDSDIYSTNSEFLATFGTQVFVRGVPYQAIYEEVETEDETGYRLVPGFSFDRKDIVNFRDDDVIHADAKNYKIRHLPKDFDLNSLIRLEVIRA